LEHEWAGRELRAAEAGHYGRARCKNAGNHEPEPRARPRISPGAPAPPHRQPFLLREFITQLEKRLEAAAGDLAALDRGAQRAARLVAMRAVAEAALAQVTAEPM